MEETTQHDMLAGPTPTLSRMRERGSPRHRVTFVDLPRHVRDKIYQEAGYRGNKFIDLNLWTINGPNKR
ncbi:unnamed protein product [Clonostachys solani]|uniref:Uncharacterized protein n=1 Tax=Clonostachys solani TaxID=160281 RepID=A0A9N9YYM3_9HYPO|nr:unnamed protein product [Clonostachys solani]